MRKMKQYREGELVVEIRAGGNTAYVIEKILIPLEATILSRHDRFGVVIIKVPTGEEDAWISYLKQNKFIANVSLHEK